MKSQPVAFNGFTPATLKFLENLKKNNSRDWFTEHKPEYEADVKGMAQSLVIAMEDAFTSTGLPYLADIKKSLFRINRDTRFSKNKDPYKTNLGVFFPYKSHEAGHKPIEATGLYFHIEPGEIFIAGGLHMPMPEQLKGIREKIAQDWQELTDIINDKKFKKEFPSMFDSESLKRIPAGYPADHPAADWLKLKGFTAFCNIDIKSTYSRDFINLLVQKAITIQPFLEFLHHGSRT